MKIDETIIESGFAEVNSLDGKRRIIAISGEVHLGDIVEDKVRLHRENRDSPDSDIVKAYNGLRHYLSKKGIGFEEI